MMDCADYGAEEEEDDNEQMMQQMEAMQASEQAVVESGAYAKKGQST